MKPKFKNIFIRREKSHAHTHARIQSHSHALYLGTAAILSGVLFFSSTPIAWALPSGGSVVGGEAIINQGGNTTTINQITDKAIIDWQKFGISADEALHFLQPGQSSVILNRVTGNESSSIFGELTANGRVFIINPNGILFGAGSSIDVAGLVATTLNIKNEDFMSGNYSFTQDEAAKLAYVVNEGRITIGDNGFAYLVAPGVQNKGIIVAKAGQVVMASGKQAYIDFSGDGLVKFKVSGKVTEKIIGPDGKPMTSAVSNSGTIKAQGGKVLLSGDAARDVVTSVVNNSGVIEASSFDDIMGGSVHLVARKNGDVINSGKISVSGKGKGKGSKAGSVVLSGENVGQFGEISADSKEGNAGSIDLRASNVVAMSNDSITTANAIDRGNGGTILVIGENSVRIGSGALLQARGGALGGDGGFIETSGHKSFEIGSAVDVSATAGKAGTWLIDPADLEIVSGNTETNINKGSGAFSSTDDSAKLGVDLITAALASGNVTIQTGDNGTQKGDITVNAEIVHTTTGDVTLTLNAHNDIIINKNISEGGSDNFNLNFVAGGNVSLADNVAITTNNGSFTSQGLNFSMANGTNATNGSSINTGTGAIIIKNTGSISLSSLNAGDIQVTQAGGITIGGTVNSTDKISLVANTGNITTSSSGLIKAKSLNLETKGTENASIGDVKYTLDSNGKTTVSLIGLNVDVNYLTASTQSGISGKVSTGNIIIENKSTGDLTLGNITTNGDKGDNDIASVIIKSSGGKITSSDNTLVDAFSASFVAKNDIDVNTKLSALNAETTSSGSITINNTSKSLFILGLIAREYGNTAILNSNDDIQVINTNNQYVNGTKNISITSTGELGIQGDISATQNVSIESKNGSIINIINDPEIHVPTITSNALSLRAAGTIGALGGALRTVTGTRIDASAGTLTIKDPSDPNKKKDIGGVYLEEMNRLNIGTITATGTEGNVNLKSVNGNAYFAHSDSKITADKSVTILATGDILTHASNSLEVIDAKSVNLIAKSIGSLNKSIKTNTGALTVQSTNEVSGSISITNSMALTSIKVITLGGSVDIDSTGADLKFGQDEKLSITNGTGTTLNFSNTLGGIKFNNIDLGTNDLTLNATRAITQSSGKLTAGNVTITAGENIGTSTKSLQTQVSSLTLTSGMNGIFIDQISNGTLKLNAVASGNDSDIKIIQTGSGNMEIKNVISKKGGVTLQSSGSIFNDNTYLSDVNISGNSLNLTAVGSIGADKKALITKVSNAGANAVFTANTTQGQIVIENSGNITLNASTSGDINFSNEGDIALGILNAGDKNDDISLKAKGTITDANGADVNITANNLDLRANSVATNADKLDILVKKLDITTTNGGLYINQTGNQDFYLNSATSMGTASIEAQGTIQLGVIDAIGQSIILKSANGNIRDNRSSSQQAKANVNAKSLDISAKELGTKLNPLSLNVDILSSSSSGNTFAENMGSLHVTSDSLTSKGYGKTVSLIASNITVFNNSGGTTTLDMNGSLELIAKNGNIIFLNTDDTIAVTGNGSILLEALGTTPPKGETGLVGLIVAGNLKTDGGNITLNASSHISINLLDAGSGNVSVISNNGLIIDNNGAKGNIIANEVTLSGKSLSDQQLVDDKATAISNVGDKNLNLNLQQQMWQYAKGDVATYKGLVDLYTQLYNASLSSVDSTQKNLDTAEQHANTLYEVFKGLTAGFDAANLAASILEIPTGAAQAVPITGDGGSALALGIAKSVLAGLQAALNQAERASDTAQDNVASLATQLMGDKSDLYTNKQSLDTNQTILDSKTVELNDLTGKVEKAEIALDASQIINNLTQQAANNNNVIGSSSQALGIQANKVNATANGQSNVYIESSSSLGVGDIIAHGNNTVVEVTAQNDISLIGKTESSKNIVLYSKEGKITSKADAKLVSNDLIAVAKQGIGTKGQAVNTQVKRLAASTETGGAYFVNTNGNEALSIDEISVNSKNLTTTVTGVSAQDDIQIQTTSDLVLNKTVSNTSKQGTVTLTATKGSILGTANNPPANHIVGGTLVATAQNGIGSDSVALRTDIAKLTGTVTGEGLVNIVEQNAIELTNITSANGSIKVTSNNGDIDAKKVVSSTDTAGNTIELTSNNGNIVAGTITAGAKHGDITLNASSGQVNNDGNTSTRITGHNLVIAANSGIGAVGTNANISLDTSVAQLDATTTTGLINISEQDNLDVKNASTGDGNITIASAQGDLNITKIVASGANNTVTLATAGKIADATIPGDENGAVISVANLSATAGNGIGEANNLIEIKVDNLEAKTTNGGVYFNDLSGDLQIGGVTPNLGKPALNGIEATAGDIVIKTAGAMLVSETVTAGNGNILLSANGGDVTTDAAVAATAGNITMTASKDVNINETVTAGNNVSLTATDGDITTNAAIKATQGNVTMDAGTNIALNGAVTASKDVSLNATSGNIKTTATVDAGNNVTMEAGTNIALDGAVTATKDVSLTATSGDIKTTTTVDAGNNVTMDAGTNIALDGAVTADKDVLLTATAGDIKTTNAAVTATTGKITMTAGTDIALDGAVTAKQDVLLKANGGNITTTAKATTTGDNVTMDASKAIALNGAVTANRDVSLTATAGDIKTTNAAV
ncbi:MAG: filamentous hemagglutinin N-terminal domain-containing protein, partial [Akkermansia sp.]